MSFKNLNYFCLFYLLLHLCLSCDTLYKSEFHKKMEQKVVMKSRFFTENVQQVAGVCWKCYQECDDVKIKAVNSTFLNLSEENKTKIKSLQITEPSKAENLQYASQLTHNSYDVKFYIDFSKKKVVAEQNFKGFSYKDSDTSLKISNNLNSLSQNSKTNKNKKYNVSTNFKKRKLKKLNFKGFSKNDSDKSIVECNKYLSITHRINIIRFLKSTRNCKTTNTNFTKFYKNFVKNLENKQYYQEANNNLNKPFTSNNSLIQISSIKSEPTNEDSFLKSTIKQELCLLKHEVNIKLEKSYIKAHIDDDFKDKNIKREIPKLKFDIKTITTKLEDDKKNVQLEIPKNENMKWHPPQSPHNLIEEILYHDPWALFVATIFLNKTSCMCARPYILQFLQDYPNPYKVLQTSPNQLESYFVNLGLKKRSVQIWRMSHDYLYKNWKHPKELFGIGKYGEDAYRMFCLGDFNVEPKDRFLRIYKAWYEMMEDHKKKGISCENYSVDFDDISESEKCCSENQLQSNSL